MKVILNKSDNIGALASTLCMLHCVATPLLFIAQSCSVSCCSATPIWWQWMDYVFLAISFYAVYSSTQATLNRSIKPVLWVSWLALFVIIMNDTLVVCHLPKMTKYIVASALVVCHLYNKKYCTCK